MATPNWYTDTVRDLQALVRKEQDAARREALGNDLIRISKALDDERNQLLQHAVLCERVRNLTWLVRSLLVVVVLEIAWMALKAHA